MALADKKTILSAQDWETEEFDVPTWGTIRIRSLTAKERLDLVEAFGSGNLSNKDAFAFYVRLLAMSMIDADGNQMFAEDDFDLLQNKSWSRLEFVAKRVMRFNKMADDDEDAEKN